MLVKRIVSFNRVSIQRTILFNVTVFIKGKHSIRLWRKTSVLRQPIESCHVKILLNPFSKQPNLTPFTSDKTENRKTPQIKRSASFTPNLHHRQPDRRSRTILKKTKFSPPCRPLLAQTSTTPHTEAHRHIGRRSCAWSLETYRSRREPRSKGTGACWKCSQGQQEE